MLRASLTVGIVVALLAVAFAAASASAGSGSGGPPVSSDPAASVYVEDVPAAGSTSGGGRNGTAPSSDPAASVYVEQVPAAGGTAGGSSNSPSGRLNLKQLLTSPTFGAPQRIEPVPGGSAGTTYGTFSFQTVREVAGVGTARLAGLLALLVLISVTLGAAALSPFARRG